MRYLDFAAAVLLVAAVGFVRLPEIDDRYGATPRRLSHLVMAATIDRVPEDVGFDLVLLGDSRSIPLDAPALCESLSPVRISCLNAATTGGDWVSAHDLAVRLEPHLMERALFVVALSDYWLEGGPGSTLELLPRTASYWALGEPGPALAAWIPLAAQRGARMRWLHAHLDAWATTLRSRLMPPTAGADRGTRRARLESVERANVDAWYAPTDDSTRERRARAGRRTLAALREAGADVVLVNLPNPALRESYVDRLYPGRRQAFRERAARLADLAGVAFIDLAGRMPDREDYRDFHHVDREAEPALRRLLADELSARTEDPAGDR
jgi:hypothetical protein